MNVDKKHIVQLQGKDFITYDGLLDMAHQMGLVSIETELIDKDPYIFKAVAMTEKQKFTGFGDADDGNVNKMIAKHKIRMAETRAKARALRDLTNVGMCSVEEMGGDGNDKPESTRNKTASGNGLNAKLKDIKTNADSLGLSTDDLRAKMEDMFGVKKSTDLTMEQAEKLNNKILDEMEEI